MKKKETILTWSDIIKTTIYKLIKPKTMKKFIEKNLAEIIVITVVAFAFSSCASTYCPYNSSYKSKNANSCAAYR